jgi:glutathione S-transferase
MTIQLYDLAGADKNLRFSPFCWRARMALAHKGLAYECVPWRFSEKAKIAATGQGAVPVIVDGEAMIHDSWAIANYLEEKYPQRPLFGNEAARGSALMIKFWTERTLHPLLVRILIGDIYANIHENDRAYFRESREKRFGVTLEKLGADPQKYGEQLQTALEPLRLTLNDQPFIAGAAPAFADYIVFGALQWARCVSPLKLLSEDDPLYAWRKRLLECFDGMAGKALARDI